MVEQFQPLQEFVYQQVFHDLYQATSLESEECSGVAQRLTVEVVQIVIKGIQKGSTVDCRTVAIALINLRLKQLLYYYQLGSLRGRMDLHSDLTALFYCEISPYLTDKFAFQANFRLIEDIMQMFYLKTLNAFRLETKAQDCYQPKTALELAEFLSFTYVYANRWVTSLDNKRERLIVRQAKAYVQRHLGGENDDDETGSVAPSPRPRKPNSPLRSDDSIKEPEIHTDSFTMVWQEMLLDEDASQHG